jgi:uncharacterized protein YjiS (DUF1127 family)
MSNSLPGSVPLGAYGVGPKTSLWPRIRALAIQVSSTIAVWSARSRQRRALGNLAELNNHLLKDIGVTPAEASREAGKWFWQSDLKA